MRALIIILVLIAFISLPSPALADTKLECNIGPLIKTYGNTQWRVYSCGDGHSLVIAADEGNPGRPFYFMFFFKDGKNQLHGEGTGSKEVTDAAYKELSVLSDQDIAALIAQTKLVGVSAAQPLKSTHEINVTSDSQPGWIPTKEQEKEALEAANGYYAARDNGKPEEAYAMMADMMKQATAKDSYLSANHDFFTHAGALIGRQIVKVTWTKDSPNAPLPGVYAAIDVASRYANVDRDCGYVVLYQKPSGGNFEVSHEENNFIPNAQAQDIVKKSSQENLDKAWAQLSANCPNYASIVPTASKP